MMTALYAVASDVHLRPLQTEAVERTMDAPGTQMPADAPAWSLHSRLKQDTIDIGDLPLCRVLVIKDAHYPWLLLVPRRPEAGETIELHAVQTRRLQPGI